MITGMPASTAAPILPWGKPPASKVSWPGVPKFDLVLVTTSYERPVAFSSWACRSAPIIDVVSMPRPSPLAS